MRLRHRPGAEEKLLKHDEYVINYPKEQKGKWQSLFLKKQPLHIEVGSGKGQFIVGMAKANPDINYVSIELQASVLVCVLDKLLEEKLPNLKLIKANGEALTEFFAEAEVSRVYLNFSDPWPKTRHIKRRLTSPKFLAGYRQVLMPHGELHFKTDNQGLFEYSLCSLSQSKWTLKHVWLDLHHSDFTDNIMTEYEEKFAAKGNRIYRLEATV